STSSNVLSVWRSTSFLLGLLLIWVAAASPVAALDEQLLTIHMVQHLLLMTLAPPLIWLGEPVKPLVRGLPRQLARFFWGPVARRSGSTISHLAVGWLAATVVLVGWHIPAAFALGMQSGAWHLVEQASFLGAGLLFWRPVVQPWPSVSRPNLSIILYLF